MKEELINIFPGDDEDREAVTNEDMEEILMETVNERHDTSRQSTDGHEVVHKYALADDENDVLDSEFIYTDGHESAYYEDL